VVDHARRLVTGWLSMRENHFGAPRAFSEFFALFLLPPFPLSLFLSSLFNVPCPCLPSSVPCSTSLFLVFRPQSPAAYIYVPCLPSPVPCLTSLFLGFGPLYPVSHLRSLSLVPCPLSHISVPWLPSPVPCITSLLLVFRPQSPAAYIYMFLVSRPLSPVSRLWSLAPVLFTLSHVICPLSPQSPSLSYAGPY
jgi:hypothetical protein